MDKNCEYANNGCCLCSACQSMKKALEEAERITSEEIDRAFQETEKTIEELKYYGAN